jgi:hypothetical protein
MKSLSPTSLLKAVPERGRRLWGSVSESASNVYVACHIDKIITACIWFVLSTFILLGALLMVLCLLWCCFIGGVASSVAVRHYMLRNIPEHQVLPLELEVASMQTEPWRWLELPAAVERAWESEGGRWLISKAQPLEGQHVDGSPQQSDGPSCDGPSAGRQCGSVTSSAATSSSMLASPTAKIAAETLSLQTQMIAEFQRSRWDSLVCHGLVRIRGVPSENDGDESTSDLFLPTATPIFNAAGAYSATLQLVFLKKKLTPQHRRSIAAAGDPVSVSVHATMLAVPRQHTSSTPPIWKLSSVFRREHGTSFLSGDVDTGASGIASLATQIIDLVMYIPKSTIGLAWSVFQEGSSVFPPLAMDGSEVAVEVPLYHRFHPPMELQHRLAALNISVFQRLEGADGDDEVDFGDNGEGAAEHLSVTATQRREQQRRRNRRGGSNPRLHVVRANVHFTVQLEGLAYLLTEFPLISAAVLTFIFFVMYVLWCACVAVGIMSGGVFIALKL